MQLLDLQPTPIVRATLSEKFRRPIPPRRLPWIDAAGRRFLSRASVTWLAKVAAAAARGPVRPHAKRLHPLVQAGAFRQIFDLRPGLAGGPEAFVTIGEPGNGDGGIGGVAAERENGHFVERVGGGVVVDQVIGWHPKTTPKPVSGQDTYGAR